ncbi:MAG TPA: ATP-binding protein [Solirubrobacteraceae bacterium]|jgi:anti-sigma regulatory factor (Ser/Thr protein kinase)
MRELEVRLPREVGASRRARALLDELAGRSLDPGELGRAKLLLSELVNNAVLHGRGTIVLRLHLDDDVLRAEVIDEGSGFERVLRENSFERIGGRGLGLVEAESSRWGVHEGTTHVWFEIERAGPRTGRDRRHLA